MTGRATHPAKPKLRCMFCGKTQREVKHLVAGMQEGAYICDECVGVSMIEMAAAGWIPPTITISHRINFKDPINCPGCKMKINELVIGALKEQEDGDDTET